MTAPTETIQYLTYFYPGSFFDEDSTKEVKKRDPKAATKNAPKGAFGFQFYERTKIVLAGETLWGEVRHKSPLHYLGGEVYTLAQVRKHFPGEKILISNMRGNGYDRVIRTRRGNWKPLNNGDVLVPAR